MREVAVDTGRERPRCGVSASLDLTHNFVEDAEHNVCAAIFMDMHSWNMAIFPMKSKSCSEFIRVLKLYRTYIRDTLLR